MEAVAVFGGLAAVAILLFLVWLRLPSPQQENVAGVVDAAMTAKLVYPVALVAALPLLLAIPLDGVRQYALMVTWWLGTGGLLLWSGYGWKHPATWLADCLRGWSFDARRDSSADVERFSRIWKRRMGLSLIAITLPATILVALLDALSA